jgi:hypothetical protein
MSRSKRLSGANFNWPGIGPFKGNGSFGITTGGCPRVCYRDFASNRIIYARSNGIDYWTESVIYYRSEQFRQLPVCAFWSIRIRNSREQMPRLE